MNLFDRELTIDIPENPLAVSVEPPIVVQAEDFDQRADRLATMIADHVIPRLSGIYSKAAVLSAQETVHPGIDEIDELSRLILGPANEDAADYILKLRDGGISLDTLHAELLEPTARHLGELWDEDKVDFLDVTIGVRRLQELVHMFSGLDQMPAYDNKRRALLVTTPGETHSFGNAMIQRFFRSGGWYVYSSPGAQLQHISALVAREWLGVVGFSLSTEKHVESLGAAIETVRKMSINRTVGIMVGGPAFAGKPELALKVGADGTAANAPAAVLLAKKLLVPSLVSVN